ncbi:rRNA-processing protein, putative [Plasmodium sp. gorilla clade G2]|uniref:rRNA-processing protein, putative n=1 Tax=Plasmodium sp. gorilla clade G2 TaxID=880535 RepID=UPI000D2128E8|nr:rRNA-processing protein, putative [Plasmodium sp. gorilla clade G2]SOV17140.1 rRNA-processing protein, putative [Plasmodium sp. gorilla clade G2]
MKERNILQGVTPEPLSVLDYVDNMFNKKKKDKELKKSSLDEWGHMKKMEKTEEIKLQWALLQHENLYTVNEYNKLKKDEKMPDFFQVATIVNNSDKIKVGGGKESQSLHTSNRRKKKTLSALQMLERNDDLKQWCINKYTKIQKQKNIGGKSFVRKQKKQLLKIKNGK